MYPKSLRELIDSLKYLPGVGEKTAERYAFSLINQDEERVEALSEAILSSKKNIKKCVICNGLSEEEKCGICSDKDRDKSVLCVVEDPKSIFIFEKLGAFNGIYHVLSGLISPLDGISPNDIGLDRLIDRIKKEKFKEIILAFKPSIEGETTSLYIKRVLEGLDVSITKIASGIPMGADMEYIDTITLERALKDRKSVE